MVWGRSRDHQQSATVGRPVRRGRARPRPGAADGVPGLLGAAHLHRPRGPADARATAVPTGSGSASCPTRSGRARGTSGSSSATASTTSSTATCTPARSRGRSRRRWPSRPRWTPSASTDPARCVYVGDRLYDDIWGAQQAGMRAVHIPLSDIPAEQVGTSQGAPDGVVQLARRRSRTSSRRGDLQPFALHKHEARRFRRGSTLRCMIVQKVRATTPPRSRTRSVPPSRPCVVFCSGECLGSSSEQQTPPLAPSRARGSHVSRGASAAGEAGRQTRQRQRRPPEGQLGQRTGAQGRDGPGAVGRPWSPRPARRTS